MARSRVCVRTDQRDNWVVFSHIYHTDWSFYPCLKFVITWHDPVVPLPDNMMPLPLSGGRGWWGRGQSEEREQIMQKVWPNSLLAAAPASGMFSVRFRFWSLQVGCQAGAGFRGEGGALQHFEFPDLSSAMERWTMWQLVSYDVTCSAEWWGRETPRWSANIPAIDSPWLEM